MKAVATHGIKSCLLDGIIKGEPSTLPLPTSGYIVKHVSNLEIAKFSSLETAYNYVGSYSGREANPIGRYRHLTGERQIQNLVAWY